MKLRLALVLGVGLIVAGAIGKAQGAFTSALPPTLRAAVSTEITTRYPPPCGGWGPQQVQSATPFSHSGDIWILTTCRDGRAFMTHLVSAGEPTAAR